MDRLPLALDLDCAADRRHPDPVLLSVAYLTYAERKVIGAMQLRQGPMVVGPMGLLQPLADAVKLLDEGDDLSDRRQ